MTTPTTNVMTEAWAIYRSTYSYPAISFASIGRKCFVWALKEAHRRRRERARIAAIPTERKEARIAHLQAEREIATYMTSWRQAQARISGIDRQLPALQAASGVAI